MVKRGSGNNLPGKRNPLIYQGNNYMNAREILEKSHYKSIEEIDKDRIDWNRKLLINLMDDTEFRMKVVEDYKIVKSGNYRKEFYIPDWAYKLADVIECGTKEYSLESRRFIVDNCQKFILESTENSFIPTIEYFIIEDFPVLTEIAKSICRCNKFVLKAKA